MVEKGLRYGQRPKKSMPLVIAVLEKYEGRWLTSGQIARAAQLENYRNACAVLARLHTQGWVERKWVKNPFAKPVKGGTGSLEGGNVHKWIWVYRWKKSPGSTGPGEGEAGGRRGPPDESVKEG